MQTKAIIGKSYNFPASSTGARKKRKVVLRRKRSDKNRNKLGRKVGNKNAERRKPFRKGHPLSGGPPKIIVELGGGGSIKVKTDVERSAKGVAEDSKPRGRRRSLGHQGTSKRQKRNALVLGSTINSLVKRHAR